MNRNDAWYLNTRKVDIGLVSTGQLCQLGKSC